MKSPCTACAYTGEWGRRPIVCRRNSVGWLRSPANEFAAILMSVGCRVFVLIRVYNFLYDYAAVPLNAAVCFRFGTR